MVLLGEDVLLLQHSKHTQLGLYTDNTNKNNYECPSNMIKRMGLPLTPETVYTHDDFLADITALKSKVAAATLSVSSVTTAVG